MTLIDDVYTKWYQTERRSGGLEWKGRPSLAQLIEARRDEIFLGDVLATNLASGGNELRNYVIAVHHPARVLSHLIFNSHPRMIYLSFPISEPRRLLQQGDSSGISEINDFLKRAFAREKDSEATVCFCPLTIDELPLTVLKGKKGTVQLQRSHRWDVTAFYGSEPLLTDPHFLPESMSLPHNQVKDATAMITSDVATRDYRLVLQSNRLAVFNPWFNGKQSKGVDNEVDCALQHHIPVHIFQDIRHDPQNRAQEYYQRSAGSLGYRESQRYITLHNTVEELFASIYQ
ncbi:MAG: hypothetical protein HY694_00290 [Deltaproteobacteria bacterium]|nr:hypothetical protein [Deltaproteobacteria bacterium]